MSRRLNEDADRYCMFWLGIMMMTAYYAEFIIKPTVGLITLGFGNLVPLLGGPLIIVAAFFGYFAPEARSRREKMRKNTSLAVAIFVALMYMIFSFVVYPWEMADVVWYSFWGIGSAIVTAGGAAMIRITTADEAYTPGIMDVSKLHYGPPPAEPEVEIEAITAESSDESKEKSEEEISVAPTEATE
ncbi:MAG: hypothetical protein ACFFED_09605 [Candidatus Thorarchaeota archaeon]